MPLALVGLGSNLGSRRAWMRLAAARLGELSAGPPRRSPLYLSRPMGPPQRAYLNAVVALRWEAEPEALLGALQALEGQLLRRRVERWGPRTIDLDLLWMEGARRDSPTLRLPHPGLLERPFTVVPALAVAPRALRPALLEALGRLQAPWRELRPARWRGRPLAVGARGRDAEARAEAWLEALGPWAPARGPLWPVQGAGPAACLRAARRLGGTLLALAPAPGGRWEGVAAPGRCPASSKL